MPQTTGPLREGARVVVVGAGRMGAQIGLEFAMSGFSTVLVNRTAESSDRARLAAEQAAATLVDHCVVDDERRSAAMARLSASCDLETACEGASYVVESVTEDMATKVDVLRRVASAAGPTAILTTNTSSLSVSELGRVSGTSARLTGTHYLNPPTLMPLVEVVPGGGTEGAIVEAVTATLSKMGKEPVLAPDIPGFIWNRLQFALLREAADLVTRQGVATSTIDRVLERGLARRWSIIGPFTAIALGGPDTFAAVAKELFPVLTSEVDPRVFGAIDLPERDATAKALVDRDRRLAALLQHDRMTDATWGGRREARDVPGKERP
jgi:3-hydroxybutyryl-CoA dehydrogenase